MTFEPYEPSWPIPADWPVVPTTVEIRERIWYVVVDCPFCGAQHRHGGASGPFVLGPRVSHCAEMGKKGHYVLAMPTYVP